MSSTGRLMEEAARLRTLSGIDRAVWAVWDAEGGREARGPTSRPRIPAVRPGTGIGPAYAAMVMAVQDDNAVSAERVPAATGITRADRSDVPQRSPG
ncbi:hypothetical protein [Streptomyces sp. NPDC054794]